MPYFVTNTFVTYSNNNNCTLQVDASQGRDMVEYEHLLFKTNGRCNTRFFQTILNRNIDTTLYSRNHCSPCNQFSKNKQFF